LYCGYVPGNERRGIHNQLPVKILLREEEWGGDEQGTWGRREEVVDTNTDT